MLEHTDNSCVLVAEHDKKVVGICTGQLLVSTAELETNRNDCFAKIFIKLKTSLLVLLIAFYTSIIINGKLGKSYGDKRIN